MLNLKNFSQREKLCSSRCWYLWIENLQTTHSLTTSTSQLNSLMILSVLTHLNTHLSTRARNLKPFFIFLL